MAITRQFMIFIIIITSFLNVLARQTCQRNRKENGFDGNKRNVIKKWEFELDNKLEYPKNDKAKLHALSSLWGQYYACSDRLARSLTPSRRLPATCHSVAESHRARLACSLCIPPDGTVATWHYSQTSNTVPSSLELDERVVMGDDSTLTINNVRKEDAGVYKCIVGQSAGGVVILEVVDKTEPYDMVKPLASHGPYSSATKHFRHHNVSLTAFTSWLPWSECSACGHVGRRRAYGMCYVKLARAQYNDTHRSQAHGQEKSINKNHVWKLFQEFPSGLPCRSRILPHHLLRLPVLSGRRNQVMIGLCKVQCERDTIYEVRSSSGTLIERANNTAGVYSLSQRLPIAPPSPVSETIFGKVGERAVLVCPGTSYRDIPVTWRAGTKALVPLSADRSSGGRVHLNPRDGLVFTRLELDDANVYSCWQRDALTGVVKLEVSDADRSRRRRILLFAMIIVSVLLLRMSDNALRERRRRAN